MKTFRFTILFVAAFVVGMFSVGAQTTITPFVQVNGGAWQQVSTVAVNAGDIVTLGTWPNVPAGWGWTGPNGFSSSSRVITVALPAPSDTYIATYTDPSGKQSVQPFTVTVNPTSLVPYVQVNGGPWQPGVSIVAVNVGDRVNLAPLTVVGGSWSWSGPSFTASTREIDAVPLTTPNNLFVVTYSNTSGVVSSQTFTVTINPTPITPFVQVNGGVWQQTGSITVNPEDVVNLATWPNVAPGWSWVGPGSYSASTREITSVPLAQGANVYTATYTNPDGAISHQSMTVTVTGYSVDLSWSAPVNPTDPVVSYHVYRATGSGAYALLGNATSIAYTDTTVADGLSYNYEVKSVDAAGVESVVSNVYTAVIP